MISSRRAFTLIELLLVMSVISILVAITTPALARSLRNAAISRAAAAIVEVARQARTMSMLERQPAALAGEAGPRCYGVLIDESAEGGRVALTWGAEGDGAPDEAGRILVRDPHGDGVDQKWRHPDWPVVGQAALGSQAVIAVGDAALADRKPPLLQWCYQYRSGAPIARCSSPESASPISVGWKARSYTDLYGIPGYDPGSADAAPAGRESPYGLTLRSRDDSVRFMVCVLPSGHAWSGRF